MSIKTQSPHLTRFLPHVAVVVIGTAVAVGAYILPEMFVLSYTPAASPAIVQNPNVPAKPAVAHLPTPQPLRAIYMSQCVVGTPSFRDSLVTFIDETELNAVVIDVRDFSGGIAFPTEHPLLQDMVSQECGARDMKSFVEKLHQKDIYVIARITTFQNPLYTTLHPEYAVQRVSGGVWKDHKGLAFVDVGAKQYWESVVALGNEAYALGFDELNFDYIRYPSDGKMAEADYTWSVGKTKPEALEEFYVYLAQELHPGAVLSADLFGMTATNEDDLNIGQVLERALPYFDAIYPMVNPSHYPKGYNGFADVNAHSYEIVKLAMDTAVARQAATTTKIASFAFTPIASTHSTSSGQASPQKYQKPVYSGKVIPWLQSFDYPVHYTPQMVRDQIRATHDAGIDSYIFWDASNKYTSLRQVLAPQPAE